MLFKLLSTITPFPRKFEAGMTLSVAILCIIRGPEYRAPKQDDMVEI